MSVVNTTYNFNQPNMNFGQALLYGAFGSLTGGMGMGGCFGGFGSPFSMGGSLFSMMGMGMGGYGCGFGGFGMGCYSDQMVGAQIGNMISGVLIGGISQAIEGRGGKQAERESLSAKITEKENEASTHLSTLGEGTSLANFNPNKKVSEYNVIKDLDKEVQSADKAKTDCEKEITSQKTEVAKLEGQVGTEPKSTEEKYKDNPELFTKEHQEWVKRQEAYEKAKKDLEDMQNSVKNDGKLGKALIDAKTAKKAKEKEVQAAIDALKTIKKEYDELKAEQKRETEARVYDDADGNWINRASKSSVEKYESGECTKSQIRKAFNLFIEAKNSGKKDDAKIWANKLVKMHNNNQDLFDNNFATAYKQVETWLKDN